MQLDSQALNRLLAMNDEMLWKSIRAIAGSNGLKLPEQTPSPKEMEKLRIAISGISENDVGNAVRIIHEMRKKGRG